MLRNILALIFPILVLSDSNDERENIFRFRYHPSDVMKADETKVPYDVSEKYAPNGALHPEASMGYMSTAGMSHGGFGGVGFSGGYYPGGFVGSGISSGGIGVGGIGAGGMGHYGHYPGMMAGGGYMGGFGGIGGEVIDKKAFIDHGKKAGGGTFEKAGGKMGQEFKEGQGGYNKGKVFTNNALNNAGYEKQNAGEKKAIEDGKTYFGGQAFNQEGKNAGEKTKKGGHKKGHKIKGFKTTHHKDESGKTEEFYDEEHDEGSDFFHKDEKGEFGEKAGSAFKGGHDNGVFNSGEKGHHSNFKKEELLHKDKGEQGEFGAQKYGGDQKAYGLNTGLDHHSLHELQEGNKMFKHYPYHVPIHSGVGK